MCVGAVFALFNTSRTFTTIYLLCVFKTPSSLNTIQKQFINKLYSLRNICRLITQKLWAIQVKLHNNFLIPGGLMLFTRDHGIAVHFRER